LEKSERGFLLAMNQIVNYYCEEGCGKPIGSCEQCRKEMKESQMKAQGCVIVKEEMAT